MDPKTLGAWLGFAIVLVALVEVVPSSNWFLQGTLWLILVYILLENAPKVAALVDSTIRNLHP